MRLCTYPGCTRPTYARGVCEGHYQMHRRTGSLGPLRGAYPPLVPVTLRVSPTCKRRMTEDPAGARDALETWAALTKSGGQ